MLAFRDCVATDKSNLRWDKRGENTLESSRAAAARLRHSLFSPRTTTFTDFFSNHGARGNAPSRLLGAL